ncbi:hypothetical protein [Streptomyces canus]|uniref:hypothetical protein n=1 Tax=Streptomyces canus TaxID=58343 RepID=UPI002DD79DD0|nr:hypothetical protein [Streptomyces canus]WSD82859.1 hypothetical protein OG925_00120 [Streptomyces canus]WSD91975.1 hypothetical protein OG925_50360 [Streptomyces canus]WSD92534.1 hypothetical protein OG925_50595 [Streptomyces canus]
MLIGSLVVGIELVLGVAIALFFIPGPVQRWCFGHLEEFERLRLASGLRRAVPLLMQILLLPPRILDRVDGYGLTPVYVVRWWRALPLAMPIKALRFGLLLVVVANIDNMADWEHLRLSADPGPQPGLVQALLSKIVAVPTAVRTWDLSVIGQVPPFLFFALILIAEVRLLNRTNLTSSGNGAMHAAYDLEALGEYPAKEGARREYRRCWPAVALLTVAAQCATVLRRWEETQPDCQIPRVSVQPVEQVIWKAHRTRRARARRHNERQFKAHAALVVGALRKAEARQDSEPGRALEDLIVMLLTIAERYAEGRIDDLLDADQLADVDPAAPRERLRMGVVGLVVVLVMACAAVLGLPEAALVPLLPVVVLFVAVVFNRGRMPTAEQLTDLIIPR